MCKQMHKTRGDQIRTLIRENPTQNVETVLQLADTVLAAAQQALRITVNRIVGMILGEMVFGRDMLLPIPDSGSDGFQLDSPTPTNHD